MSKYTPLQYNLRGRPRMDMELSFEEVEKILGFSLPPSAREHSAAWWSNERETHVQARAWMDAGWQVWHVSRSKEKVFLKPIEQGHPPHPPPTRKATVAIDLALLSSRGARLISDYAGE